MKTCDITVGRTDLRWLNKNGESPTKGKRDYVFRSETTDEAQKLIQENGFEGSYMRHLSTGHCETQQINLAMLSLAQHHEGIVGVTLQAFTRDKICQMVVRYPPGRILYEILNDPTTFRVSTDQGVVLPNFDERYASIDTYVGTLFEEMKLVPQKQDRNPNRQAARLQDKIYIELQPEFVAKIGSIDMMYGPHAMHHYRAAVELEKEKGRQENIGLTEKILKLLGLE